MRNDNTFGIHFILRMNKVKNGKAPLYARITVNASRIEVSLKTLVEISDWNPSKGLAKPKNEKAKELNSFPRTGSRAVRRLLQTIATAEENYQCGSHQKFVPGK